MVRTLFIEVVNYINKDSLMTVRVRYRAATDSDLQRIKSFLKENDLPELGVDQWIKNFVVAEDQDRCVIGVAGLELYEQSGLLRSVAVDERYRGRGVGRGLVESVVASARARGIGSLYLLTEGATTYFRQFGFEPVDRGNVDDAVKTSIEFTQICKTATAMHRTILPRA